MFFIFSFTLLDSNCRLQICNEFDALINDDDGLLAPIDDALAEEDEDAEDEETAADSDVDALALALALANDEPFFVVDGDGDDTDDFCCSRHNLHTSLKDPIC